MSETPSALKTLRDGGTVGAVWACLGAPQVAELMVESGPDAIVFDGQHGLWDRLALEHAIGIVRPATPLVRVAENSLVAINSALDAGAAGVIVPLVDTPEDAAAAVAAAKYPPEGIRSGGGVRPLKDFKAYVRGANDRVLVGVMIETREAVANAAAIAAVEGVDLVFIGTGDLALSLGTFPDFGPAHEAACEAVLAACDAAGVPCGLYSPHVTFALDARRRGFRFVVTAADIDLVRGAKAHVRRFGLGAPRDLAGAVVLVTGTSRGIGPETVRALLAAGAAKVYCAARDPQATTALVAESEALVPLKLDVTDAAEIAAAAAQCPDVTLLVNNAGVNFNKLLFSGPDADHARVEMETNYFGTLAMCRAFAPVLAANGGGAIVNMLSILAHMNLPEMGSLCASKAAELSLTQALRAELSAQGTHVMAVLPGAVDTDMARDFDGDKLAPAAVAAALVDGLRRGLDEVYPGEMAAGVAAGLATDPKAVEREFAQYLPKVP